MVNLLQFLFEEKKRAIKLAFASKKKKHFCTKLQNACVSFCFQAFSTEASNAKCGRWVLRAWETITPAPAIIKQAKLLVFPKYLNCKITETRTK